MRHFAKLMAYLVFCLAAQLQAQSPAATNAAPEIPAETFPEAIKLNPEPGTYAPPLFLRVETLYEGKLMYALGADSLAADPAFLPYRGRIRIGEVGKHTVHLLLEDKWGRERRYGPYRYSLHLGQTAQLPAPVASPPGGAFLKSTKVEVLGPKGAVIHYRRSDENGFRTYREPLLLDSTTVLRFKAVGADSIESPEREERYIIVPHAPKVELVTENRTFNAIPRIEVRLQNAEAAHYSLDPLAPLSSFTPMDSAGGFTLPEGRHRIRIYATNKHGMQSETISAFFHVDTTPPRAKFHVDVGARAAHISASENAAIFYTTDGSVPSNSSRIFEKPISLPVHGLVPIRFFAQDSAGNRTQVIGFEASADTIAPRVRLTPPEGSYAGKVIPRFQCNEPCKVYYLTGPGNPLLEGRAWNPDSAALVLEDNGTSILAFAAVDLAGNTSEPGLAAYVIDRLAPIVRVRVRREPGGREYTVGFTANEPSDIHYTVDGSLPTEGSPLYSDEIRVTHGSRLQFRARDESGNWSEVQTVDELLQPTVLAEPAGGIFNRSLQISLKASNSGPVQWDLQREDRPRELDFSDFKQPIGIERPGRYILSVRAVAKDGKWGTVRQEVYLIDKIPPQITPLIRLSASRDSTVVLEFRSSEAARIFYTLNGTDPAEGASPSLGSPYREEEMVLSVPRRSRMILKYFAIDRAANRSPLYELDILKPFVTSIPPPGSYEELLTVELNTQTGNRIHFASDSVQLASASTVYSEPLILTSSKTLWFYAVDPTGYAGPIQKAVFELRFPPEPDFSISSENIPAGMPVQVDASLSVDEETPFEQLLFRWDFDSDGKFDTEYASSPSARTVYHRPGVFQILLEVKDGDGQVNQSVREIRVPPRCPSDMVGLTDGVRSFCIDRFEYPNHPDEPPRASVNWAEATMLCREKGRRLCRSDEWTMACRGLKGNHFSYGPAYVEGRCNVEGEAQVASLSKSSCASSEGLIDMVGNLWEWVEDRDDSGHHLMHGGSFRTADAASCGLQFPGRISDKSKVVGFRCCQ